MTSLRIKHPILRLDVVGADGTLVSEHVVFCQQQRQTVHVEECCACVHCDAIAEGEPPTVDCSTAAPPAALPPDRDGESTAVASMLCRGTVVVAQSVSLVRALALVHDDDRRSLAIVDDAHVMVGVVHDGAAGRSRRPHAASVGAAMTAVIAIDERTPVRVALRLLAASHLREATVISGGGVPIGVFTDVDGLRWIARARR